MTDQKPPIEILLDEIKWEAIARPDGTESSLPYATHVGVLTFGAFSLRCYQLSTGQRIFDADDIEAFFAGETPTD